MTAGQEDCGIPSLLQLHRPLAPAAYEQDQQCAHQTEIRILEPRALILSNKPYFILAWCIFERKPDFQNRGIYSSSFDVKTGHAGLFPAEQSEDASPGLHRLRTWTIQNRYKVAMLL